MLQFIDSRLSSAGILSALRSNGKDRSLGQGKSLPVTVQHVALRYLSPQLGCSCLITVLSPRNNSDFGKNEGKVFVGAENPLWLPQVMDS